MELLTKQEEIREGIFKVLFPYSNADHYTGDETVQKVLEHLHSQGVVIKVERELPIEVECESGVFEYLADSEVSRFPAVEPLIKEK